MPKFYFLNGEIVKESDAKLHVSDLSILRGYGIFDFFRTSDGKPLFMHDHIERFNRSAASFHLDHGYHNDYIIEKISSLIELNGYDESGIKLVLTGGYSENGFDPGKPNFAILVDRLPQPKDQFYAEGVKLISHLYSREFPEVKSTNYLTALLLAKKWKAEHALDGLYHNGKYISELSRSNIFLVKNNQLITPGKGILKGITRSKVIHLAAKEMEVIERDVRLQEVMTAEELFITSSIKRVMPVVNVDGNIIGEGKPGEVTKKLITLFSAYEKRSINL